MHGRRDGWLRSGSRVLASAEISRDRRERRRGLVGRPSLDGVLVLPVRWVHTVGVRFPIDVVHCDAAGTVVRIDRMPPRRLGRPCPRGRWVVEAPAGAVASWGLAVGDRLEWS